MSNEAAVDAGGGESVSENTGSSPTNTGLPNDAQNNTPDAAAQSANEVSQEAGSGQSEFELPEDYKEKSWANKIKTQEDLYKQIDNLTELVGKKTISPIDYNTASEEDISAYHKSIVPEEVDAYKFQEDADPEFSKAIVPALQEAGIHPAQLKSLEPAINKIASELVGKQYEADRSEDGYFELTKEAFGDDHKNVVASLEAIYKEHVPEAAKSFLDNATNQERAYIDQTLKSIIDAKDAEIAKIKKDYGVSETGAQSEGDPATQRVNIDDLISEKRKEINELSSKSGQKNWDAIKKAKDDLKALYDKKVKR